MKNTIETEMDLREDEMYITNVSKMCTRRQKKSLSTCHTRDTSNILNHIDPFNNANILHMPYEDKLFHESKRVCVCVVYASQVTPCDAHTNAKVICTYVAHSAKAIANIRMS